MAAVQSHRLAGSVCMPKKASKNLKRYRLLPSTCLFIALVCSYLLLRLTFTQQIDKNSEQVLYPTKKSQHLLYTKLLDNGRARLPSGKDEQSDQLGPFLGIAHVMMILLLAGDIEMNPGPLMNSYYLDAKPPQLTGPLLSGPQLQLIGIQSWPSFNWETTTPSRVTITASQSSFSVNWATSTTSQATAAAGQATSSASWATSTASQASTTVSRA